jgi:alanyl-tRNA synthetase
LCGGTHVRATGDIGSFTILQESGVAAGVRRIEAVTGTGAFAFLTSQRRTLEAIVDTLKTPADAAVGAVERLQAETRRLARENAQLKMKVALSGGAEEAATEEGVDAGGVMLTARRVSGLDKTALGQMADALRGRMKSGVVVLASEHEGRVWMVVAVTKDLAPAVHAGQIVKRLAPMVGGGGGGRPDYAEAGGKDPSGIGRMLEEARRVVGDMAGQRNAK